MTFREEHAANLIGLFVLSSLREKRHNFKMILSATDLFCRHAAESNEQKQMGRHKPEAMSW